MDYFVKTAPKIEWQWMFAIYFNHRIVGQSSATKR